MTYSKEHYQQHKERWQRYYTQNRDTILAKDRERYRLDPSRKRDRAKRENLRFKLKAIAVLGSKCEQCGFNHPAALQFHHKDPSQKEFVITCSTMSSSKKRPWNKIVEEIQKCELLCANCHFVHHSDWDYV